jgi:hypothetical protein
MIEFPLWAIVVILLATAFWLERALSRMQRTLEEIRDAAGGKGNDGEEEEP